MNTMSGRILLLFSLAVLTLITPVPIHAWQWQELRLKKVPVPSVLNSLKTETSTDLDSDGIPETLMLTDGRVAIRTGSETRWQSPQGWRVAQAQITDLNRDGQSEAALLVWR